MFIVLCPRFSSLATDDNPDNVPYQVRFLKQSRVRVFVNSIGAFEPYLFELMDASTQSQLGRI